ncbi:MAG: hypothetical protein CMG71_07430 [Candidatus Marinimicrobia bacterium]|nr:hypothetical protein [Candidatus Neomarinimicrobiota bacterium]
MGTLKHYNSLNVDTDYVDTGGYVALDPLIIPYYTPHTFFGVADSDYDFSTTFRISTLKMTGGRSG